MKNRNSILLCDALAALAVMMVGALALLPPPEPEAAALAALAAYESPAYCPTGGDAEIKQALEECEK